MGTNVLFTRAPNDIIESDDVNQYYTSLNGTLVPRNGSGSPTDLGGDFGSSTYRWQNAYIGGTLNIGLVASQLTINEDATDMVIGTAGVRRATFYDDGSITFGSTATTASNFVSIGSSGTNLTASGTANELSLFSSGNCGLTIFSGTTSFGAVYFGDSGGNAQGRILYDHSNEHLSFHTGTNFVFRVDSSSATKTGWIYRSSGNSYLTIETDASDEAGIILDSGGTQWKIYTDFSDEDLKIVAPTANTQQMIVDQVSRFQINIADSSNARKFYLVYPDATSNDYGAYFECTDSTVSSTHDLMALDYSDDQNNLNYIVFLDQNGVNGRIESNTTGSIVYTTTSDLRLKENIDEYKNGIDAIKSIEAKTFLFKKDKNKTKHIGFIAQDVAQVLPEICKTNEDPEKMMSLDYGKFTPVLWSALREVINRLEKLEANHAD